MMTEDWPIFVLSLPGDEARRQPLLNRMTQMGLPFRLFYGVDGRAGLPADSLPLIDRDATVKRMGRAMTDGEFACALSHQNIYRTILDEGLPGAVVLEDDAILTDDFADYLQAGHHRRQGLTLFDYRFARALPWQRERLGRWVLFRAAQQSTLATAYGLSREAAAWLIDANSPVSFVADWPVDLYHHRVWLVTPRIVQHNQPGTGPSHLHQERAKTGATVMGLSRGQPGYWRSYLRRKIARKVGR